MEWPLGALEAFQRGPQFTQMGNGLSTIYFRFNGLGCMKISWAPTVALRDNDQNDRVRTWVRTFAIVEGALPLEQKSTKPPQKFFKKSSEPWKRKSDFFASIWKSMLLVTSIAHTMLY
jgi:hypothetical protein